MFQISWYYTENFDYWGYLEEKSHFDRLGASVDKSLAKHLAPVSELANQGLVAQSEHTAKLVEATEHQSQVLKNSMEAGFEALQAGNKEIAENID